MVLVDIGNTNFHIYRNGEITDLKSIPSFNEKVYYISVNEEKEAMLLKKNKNAINLKNYVKFPTEYEGLGIDRIMACMSVKNGVVVDAGSAVTIDVMEEGIHKGGIITPGIYAFKKSFATISKVLEFDIEKIDLNKLPLNTQTALNYGSIGAIVSLIERVGKNKKIYLTGGDGGFLLDFIKNATFVEDLVFRGMIKTIKDMKK